MFTRITLATVKSFIKKNPELYFRLKSSFNGMTDGVEDVKDQLSPATRTENNLSYTLGIEGAWFVGGSRDYFSNYSDGTYEGIEVFNSCGSFILARKKAVEVGTEVSFRNGGPAVYTGIVVAVQGDNLTVICDSATMELYKAGAAVGSYINRNQITSK